MTRSLGAVLPQAVMRGLREEPSAEDQATLVITDSVRGYPHVTHLSQAQIGVPDATRLRLAMWPESTAVENIRRTSRLALYRIDEAAAYTVHARCMSIEAHESSGDVELTWVEGLVVEVWEDTVPYADLVSPVRFRLLAPEQVLPAWSALKVRLDAKD